MDTSELLKKVRKIEIKTKGLSRNIFAGEYHSAFKGRGMTFSEVREYQYGDDIRNIDWNVTARFNHPYVKVFEEERELTVILLIDVSASNIFGTNNTLKKDLITEVAAVLAFSAIQNNDKIGVIFFSDKVEKFIPPKKGRKQTLFIIRELLTCTGGAKNTDVANALKFLTNTIKKRSTVFLISDFMSPDFSDALKIAGYKHDVIALNVFDRREYDLPDIGWIKIADPEGKTRWIDTSSAKVRKAFLEHWLMHKNRIEEAFKKAGVDFADIETGKDYVRPLIRIFKLR